MTYTLSPLRCSELERQANIARNQALLEQIFQGEESLVSRKRKVEEEKANKKQAKPVGSEKRIKRETPEPPRRQSARLRREVKDPNESPAQRRKREVYILLYHTLPKSSLT